MSFVALDDYLFDGIASGLLSVDHGQGPGRQGTWPMNCRLLKSGNGDRWAALSHLGHLRCLRCRLLNEPVCAAVLPRIGAGLVQIGNIDA